MYKNSMDKGYIFTSLLVYFFVFVSISFILTCSLSLFLWDAPLSVDFIRASAPKTFSNVFILSFLFTCILMLVKYLVFDKPQQVNHKKQINEEKNKVESIQSDFISNVSHEIKTPLSVISNYVNLLKSSEFQNPEDNKYLDIIQTQTIKISEMVTNILKLNKLENKTFEVKKEIFNLSDFICNSLLSFEHIWQNKNIDIQTNVNENIFIKTDKQLLELVFNNLFSNALKFTESNGCVFVDCSEDKNFIYLEVTDTGCGISSEIGKRIFEKFYQADTSHKVDGNGLGLALVKEIIDILAGEITVKSELGKGSTFLITLKK